ncbi:hypothetical protein I656_01670 [Geobacillus sp. WSUCF1]|nr:hypothetical protein I656_01670 [Geobacillus sp. WSUCF1]
MTFFGWGDALLDILIRGLGGRKGFAGIRQAERNGPKGGDRMSNKGRQNKVSQETANPTVSKAEAEMAKDSVDTAKQAKKNRS